jgi:hypothetical protein
VVLSLLYKSPLLFLVLLTFGDLISVFAVVPRLEFFLRFVSVGSLLGLFVGLPFDDLLDPYLLFSGNFCDACFFFRSERFFVVVSDSGLLGIFNFDELASYVSVILINFLKITAVAVLADKGLIPRVALIIYPSVVI